jgi:DNA gyrase/topoisomerase IV subunit A
MGRATSGVIGMRFNDGDELLGMYVVRDGGDVLVATGGGYAKRTPVDPTRCRAAAAAGSSRPRSSKPAASWSAR